MRFFSISTVAISPVENLRLWCAVLFTVCIGLGHANLFASVSRHPFSRDFALDAHSMWTRSVFENPCRMWSCVPHTRSHLCQLYNSNTWFLFISLAWDRAHGIQVALNSLCTWGWPLLAARIIGVQGCAQQRSLFSEVKFVCFLFFFLIIFTF